MDSKKKKSLYQRLDEMPFSKPPKGSLFIRKIGNQEKKDKIQFIAKNKNLLKNIFQFALILIGCFSFYKGFSLKLSWQGIHSLGYFIFASCCIIGIVWLEIKKK